MNHSPADTGSKYVRKIYPRKKETHEPPIHVDVYNVIVAFNVTNPGLQHAIKKLLCAGIRGKNNFTADCKEAIDAITRAVELEEDSTKQENRVVNEP